MAIVSLYSHRTITKIRGQVSVRAEGEGGLWNADLWIWCAHQTYKWTHRTVDICIRPAQDQPSPASIEEWFIVVGHWGKKRISIERSPMLQGMIPTSMSIWVALIWLSGLLFFKLLTEHNVLGKVYLRDTRGKWREEWIWLWHTISHYIRALNF